MIPEPTDQNERGDASARGRTSDGRFRSPVPIGWAKVRAEYEAGEAPIDEILLRHNLAVASFYDRRRVEGWVMRRASALFERGNLIARLFRVLDRQAQFLENTMTESGDKEARVLSNLARTLDRLIEIENGERKARGPTRRGRDMNDLRRDLAKRIVSLSKR